MQFIFDNVTIGGNANYKLKDWDLGISLDNVNIKQPRSDLSKNVADWFNVNVKTLAFTLIGSNQSDYRDKKLVMINKLRNTYTFQMIDRYKNADGTYIIYASYQFTGKITDIKKTNELSNKCDFELKITCEDSLLYSTTVNSLSTGIITYSLYVPVFLPAQFVTNTNSISINNTGIDTDVTFTLHGAFKNLRISNSAVPNEIFTYTDSLSTIDSLVITTIDSDPIKVRKNTIPAIAYTNTNWLPLKLKNGVNVFSFYTDGNTDVNTLALITYQLAYKGI